MTFYVVSYASLFFTIIDLLLFLYAQLEFKIFKYIANFTVVFVIVWLAYVSYNAYKEVNENNNANGVESSTNSIVLITFAITMFSFAYKNW